MLEIKDVCVTNFGYNVWRIFGTIYKKASKAVSDSQDDVTYSLFPNSVEWCNKVLKISTEIIKFSIRKITFFFFNLRFVNKEKNCS